MEDQELTDRIIGFYPVNPVHPVAMSSPVFSVAELNQFLLSAFHFPNFKSPSLVNRDSAFAKATAEKPHRNFASPP